MDDLENAILISFNESGNVDSVLKSQAIAYCQQIKEKPSICSLCIEKLYFTERVEVQFWCLQCLHEVLQVRYSFMAQEEKSFIRNSVFSIACSEGIDGKSAARILDGPAFIKNKLAQVLVSLILFEYPLIWSSVFVDFLPNLRKGPVVIDMFCRILNALDDEIISLDYPRSAEEVAVAAQVKDAMRQQCIPQIVAAWYDIVSVCLNSDAEICSVVLDTMKRYISWIDIGLIANDAFTRLLFDLISSGGLPDQLRGASASCVLAVVSKRMVPKSKLTLLQNLNVSRVFGLVVGDNDSELVSKLATLLIGYAAELLECAKRLNFGDGKEVATELLNEVLPSVFHVMQTCEIDATFSIVQFLSGYVATMKSLSPLTERQLLHVNKILEVIRGQILFDPVYRESLDALDKVGREEEDRMVEFRKDLFILLQSIGRVAPDVTQLFLRNALASAVVSSSDKNVEEVEAALSLFYELGESLSDDALRTGSGLLRELIPTLLSTKFPCHSNRLVALVYLDTITRYMKFVQDNTQYIPLVLSAFLDERGIHHQNVNVSRRASYLFTRVVKLLKPKLVPFVETILQSLQDMVANFTCMDFESKELSGSEDGSHVFEVIGLLIGMEDMPPEKQFEYLSALLNPLCEQQIKVLLLSAKLQNAENSSARISKIQQIVMAINALSKGFSERLVTASRPAIGQMFKQTLDLLLQILVEFPKLEPLRVKVTSFIHRMVDTLGVSVFPYLPKALEQLLVDSEPRELVSLLLLLNQLMRKFNISVRGILEEVYPTIASRVFNILPNDGFPADPSSSAEEVRELQELQRILYTFLDVITTHDLSSVFLSPNCKDYLEPMMQLLLYASCNHRDFFIRKECVKIFIRLIKDWCTMPCDQEKVPGFRNFVMEAFATNCCLYSVLDKSFELQDGNTRALFGEIVMAQKVMYEKFGNDFLIHYVSKGFPNALCSQDLAGQYCQKLQSGDTEEFRSFYQSLVEKLRHQQNGSLVFR